MFKSIKEFFFGKEVAAPAGDAKVEAVNAAPYKVEPPVLTEVVTKPKAAPKAKAPAAKAAPAKAKPAPAKKPVAKAPAKKALAKAGEPKKQPARKPKKPAAK